MATLREWIWRVWGSLRRGPGDGQLEEELRMHLELAGEQAKRLGASPDGARRAARLQAGSVAQTMEAMRDQRGFPWLDDLARDTRHGIRALRRNPTFTLVALLTLSIGIGANTAIFSVVNGVLIKPLPYPDADRLVSVGHGTFGSAPFLYFTEREQNTSFDAIGAYNSGNASVTGKGEPEQVQRLVVTSEILPALGIQPLLGRYFSPGEDAPGSPNTVVLTHGFWQRRFGGDPAVVGTSVTIDRAPWTIIGVMPARFRFLDRRVDLITPFRFDRSQMRVGNFSVVSIARLSAGVTLERAAADVDRLVPIALDSFPLIPGFSRDQVRRMPLSARLKPLKQDVVGDAGTTLWVLMGTIGLVLLMACANVANLMLVRAESRQQELSVRAALGAGWSRIARELLTESALLSVAGGALGIGFAYGCLRVLLPIAPGSLPRMADITIDSSALLFALCLSLCSAVLFGAIPVVRYARPHATTALPVATRSSTVGREHFRARGVLVVVQVALSLVLLTCAGLMIRTFRELRDVDPGFSGPNEVQTAQITIPFPSIADAALTARRQHDILDRIAAVPGVTSVAFANAVPMGARFQMTDLLFPEGKVFGPGDSPKARHFRFISPRFFGTMGIPLVMGRDLTWTDVHERRAVVLVSENLARAEWGSPAGAIGRHLRGSSAKDAWREIVGVVADVRDVGPREPAPQAVYFPVLVERIYDNPVYVWRSLTYAIRSPRTGTPGFLDDIRRAVWAVDQTLPLADVSTMEDLLAESMARTSFTLILLALAGTMALLLGVIGIYGVISYAVSQRTREIGIRLALGAQPGELKGMVVRQGLVLTGIGMAIGLAAAMGLTRLMSSLLYGISPRDPLTFATVPVLLATAALLASYLPARRAAAVDPVIALRAE